MEATLENKSTAFRRRGGTEPDTTGRGSGLGTAPGGRSGQSLTRIEPATDIGRSGANRPRIVVEGESPGSTGNGGGDRTYQQSGGQTGGLHSTGGIGGGQVGVGSDGSGSIEDRIAGISGELAAGRNEGESAAEWRKRYKRLSAQRKRLETKRGTDGRDTQNLSREVDLPFADDPGEDDGGFELTVEAPPGFGEGEEEPQETGKRGKATLQKEEKAKSRSTAAKKYKEPPKSQVDIIAGGLQDIYSVIDSFAEMGMKLSGKPYIPGLFQLADDKAVKASRALAQINNSLPKMAERLNKVGAPAVLISVLGADLVGKAMIMYGLVKSANVDYTQLATDQKQSIGLS